MESAAKQISIEARSGLVFWRRGTSFVSLREGSAGSWLVSSKGFKERKKKKK